MTTTSLAQSYLRKASARLKLLSLLLKDQEYSDVIREAQEAVELALKGMLRHQGIEPPKWHDVGSILLEHQSRFPEDIQPELKRLAGISTWLRKERELSFYGDIDFIPSENYSLKDAERACSDAKFCVEIASKLIKT